MSALSDLLVDNLPEGWSHRQVGREARKRGFSISDATATNYLGGRHGRPDPDTIAGFAATLRIPLRVLREAAGLPPEPGQPWVPPVEASDLDVEQRRILDSLVKVMARDARRAGGGDGRRDATPKTGPVDLSWSTGDDVKDIDFDFEVTADPGSPVGGEEPRSRAVRRRGHDQQG